MFVHPVAYRVPRIPEGYQRESTLFRKKPIDAGTVSGRQQWLRRSQPLRTSPAVFAIRSQEAQVVSEAGDTALPR